MNPAQDHKSVLSEVIRKQIAILGPQITIQEARKVPGLTVSDDGSVVSITGDPQVVMQGVVDQFVQLSGMIVRKTMEPLLAFVPGEARVSQVSPQAEIDKALKGMVSP